jgi:hypothetical protein
VVGIPFDWPRLEALVGQWWVRVEQPVSAFCGELASQTFLETPFSENELCDLELKGVACAQPPYGGCSLKGLLSSRTVQCALIGLWLQS